MATVRHDNKKEKIGVGFEEATQHVLSEGEILIKNLVQKQTNTNINLHEQLKNEKKFDKPTEIIPLSNITSGQTSLEEFQKCTTYIDDIEKLKYYELSPQEIQLYLDSKEGEEYLIKKHKNISKYILKDQLKRIQDKIDVKNNRNVENNVSRHYKDIGLSVKPESEETKLLQFALSNFASKNDNLPKEHPINNLIDLERDLFGHLDRNKVPSLAKRRKKSKKYENDNKESININNHIKSNKESKWDLKDIPTTSKEILKIISKKTTEQNSENSVFEKVYTCKQQQFYTVKDGKIEKLEKSNENEDFKIKEYKKLSIEEIKNIPKFENYEQGVPSNVLYVKNIANSARDEFMDIFKFIKNVKCKLMTGKMKGQAFLTFENVNEATEALNKYNGYILGDKPIVIQYGKSHKNI